MGKNGKEPNTYFYGKIEELERREKKWTREHEGRIEVFEEALCESKTFSPPVFLKSLNSYIIAVNQDYFVKIRFILKWKTNMFYRM